MWNKLYLSFIQDTESLHKMEIHHIFPYHHNDAFLLRHRAIWLYFTSYFPTLPQYTYFSILTKDTHILCNQDIWLWSSVYFPLIPKIHIYHKTKLYGCISNVFQLIIPLLPKDKYCFATKLYDLSHLIFHPPPPNPIREIFTNFTPSYMIVFYVILSYTMQDVYPL